MILEEPFFLLVIRLRLGLPLCHLTLHRGPLRRPRGLSCSIISSRCTWTLFRGRRFRGGWNRGGGDLGGELLEPFLLVFDNLILGSPARLAVAGLRLGLGFSFALFLFHLLF